MEETERKLDIVPHIRREEERKPLELHQAIESIRSVRIRAGDILIVTVDTEVVPGAMRRELCNQIEHLFIDYHFRKRPKVLILPKGMTVEKLERATSPLEERIAALERKLDKFNG